VREFLNIVKNLKNEVKFQRLLDPEGLSGYPEESETDRTREK
jgi:hypothetical protein